MNAGGWGLGDPSDAKTQFVRVLDVLVFGPLMVYVGLHRAPPTWLKWALLVVGIGTIIYNGINFLAIQGNRGPERHGQTP